MSAARQLANRPSPFRSVAADRTGRVQSRPPAELVATLAWLRQRYGETAFVAAEKLSRQRRPVGRPKIDDTKLLLVVLFVIWAENRKPWTAINEVLAIYGIPQRCRQTVAMRLRRKLNGEEAATLVRNVLAAADGVAAGLDGAARNLGRGLDILRGWVVIAQSGAENIRRAAKTWTEPIYKIAR